MEKVKTRRLAFVSWMAVFAIQCVLFNGCSLKGSSNKTNETPTFDSVKFSYSAVIGVGVDSVWNRRDPSDIIKVGNKYYVWYTKMKSPVTSGYWGNIWYAVSEDEGHTWEEKGLALDVGSEGQFDSHSVFTPNILVYEGKYYLYYTGVKPTPGNPHNKFENNSTNDFTAIGLAVAESPGGPFVRVKNNPVLEISSVADDFDSYRIDDASLLVKDGKIWLYYKGRSAVHGKKGAGLTKMGVAVADHPEGPFEKHSKPLIERSHEVLIWAQNGGVASLASLSRTIYWSNDGINFNMKQDSLVRIPKAPGLYRPELEEGNKEKDFPGWGIAMVQKRGLAYLLRFEIKRE